MMSVSLPGLLGSERSFTRSLNRLFGDLVSKSCLTLGNTVDCSPPAPLVPGKNTGVGCHFLLQGIFPT